MRSLSPTVAQELARMSAEMEPRLTVRHHIEALELAVRSGLADGTLEDPVGYGGSKEGNDKCEHYFGDGVYVRALLIPAGSCVIGRLHKQARVCIILSGKCRFVDEFQERTVEGPWIGEFRAGSKTAVFAETDTYWAACVGTDIKDPIEAFETLTCGSHDELLRQLTGEHRPALTDNRRL